MSLVDTIEMISTLDDKIVATLENHVYKTPPSTAMYVKDNLGRHTHDPKNLDLGTQRALLLWQDGEFVGVWPNKWKPAPGVEVTFKGVKPI